MWPPQQGQLLLLKRSCALVTCITCLPLPRPTPPLPNQAASGTCAEERQRPGLPGAAGFAGAGPARCGAPARVARRTFHAAAPAGSTGRRARATPCRRPRSPGVRRPAGRGSGTAACRCPCRCGRRGLAGGHARGSGGGDVGGRRRHQGQEGRAAPGRGPRPGT